MIPTVLFGSWDPEGKDVLMLIAGFLLGYIASFAQSRYDKYKATMTEAVKACDIIHEKLFEASSGLDIFFVPRSVFKPIDFELLLQGHQRARDEVQAVSDEMDAIISGKSKAAQELPETHRLLLECRGDRQKLGVQLAAHEMRRNRERWIRRILTIEPDYDVLIPFGHRLIADEQDRTVV
jgi:hypothetical protein